MTRNFAQVTFLAVALPCLLLAKASTVKITVSGGSLAAPVEYGSDNLGQFHIWDGPGTMVNGVPQTTGFIIDWSKGPVTKRPTGLRHYEISFYTGCRSNEQNCRTTSPILSYIVSYEYDPSTKQGYVYLPGKSDQHYSLNTSSIYRGLEGNWFVASTDWREFVQLIIQAAKR